MDKQDMAKHSAWNEKWKNPNENVKYEYGMCDYLVILLIYLSYFQVVVNLKNYEKS
jgi:hypothetical protein